MYQPPLPQVVEFGHHYDVKIERDGNFTRVTASIKATQYTSTYKKIHDLPFCALDPSSQTWKFWSFPKAANTEEATVRGRYFWEEFVRFTRGHQKKRRAEALYSLRHSIFPAICKNWGDESGVFMDQLCETVIDSLRVGVE